MDTETDCNRWWNHRRRWLFNPQQKYGELLAQQQENTSVKQANGYTNFADNNVSIFQTVSFSVRMEALKVALAVQKEVAVAIETHYFRPLREGVASGLDPETDVPKPTLAEQTRYIRLQALINVLKELIPIELRLLSWLEGLEDNIKPTVASDIHNSFKQLEEVSHRIPDEWGTCGSPSGGSVTSQEDILIEVTTSPNISLERRINYLHRSLEALLVAVRQLLVNVIDRNLDMISSNPCDVTPNDVASLLLKLPQKYIIEED